MAEVSLAGSEVNAAGSEVNSAGSGSEDAFAWLEIKSAWSGVRVSRTTTGFKLIVVKSTVGLDSLVFGGIKVVVISGHAGSMSPARGAA